MFECNRENFIVLKNITNAPSWEFLQKFYRDNSWRIDVSADLDAINCYERLYYFWQTYKVKEFSSVWLAGLFFGLLLIGNHK
jgi:hypothetical protein